MAEYTYNDIIIDPESEEKTIIFAVNDHHADEIVDKLRDIYKAQEVPSGAIEKITYKIGDRARVQDAIKRFKNEHYPTIAVTVDLLSTGIDVPEITKIVFMRRIKSRILYEQMLGRATRLCSKINKTHFDIYDAVDLYSYLDEYSSMKPVVANPSVTFDELFEGYEKVSDEEADKDKFERYTFTEPASVGYSEKIRCPVIAGPDAIDYL